MLEIRDLQLFLDVVDSGTISAGAERSGLSLSAASVRISSLERRLQVTLLERGRRGVLVTDSGQLLADHARDVLDRANDLEAALAPRAHRLRHTLRLSTSSSAIDAIPELLAAALNQMPDLSIDVHELSSVTAVDELRHGQADLALISTAGEVDLRGCDARTLWTDPLGVIDRSGGLPASMTFAEAVGEPLIGLADTVPFQQLVERRSRQHRLHPTYRIRLPGLAAVCALASTGAGRAVVPLKTALRQGVDPDIVVPLSDPWAASRRTVLAGLDLARLAHPASRFADLLVRYGEEVDDAWGR